MSKIVDLRPRPSSAERRAQAWEGLLRVMEANGRKHVEIGIDDVREVAELLRRSANGRE